MKTLGVILAAGKGTRMKSCLPKVLHKLCGRTLVEWVANAYREAGIKQTYIVVGTDSKEIENLFNKKTTTFVKQAKQLGTGHACQMILPYIKSFDGLVAISPGDAPLVTAEVFKTLIQEINFKKADCAMAVANMDNPTGYGRIIRDANNNVNSIVEEKDATKKQKQIKEVATSFYVFKSEILKKYLPKLKNNNAQKEFYLTDIVSLIAQSKGKVVAVNFDDYSILEGVNNKSQLAQAENKIRLSILKKHMLNGSTIQNPETITIDADVTVGTGTTIEPNTLILGKTKIGNDCVIGPNTRIEDTIIENDVIILMSHISRAKIHSGVRIGPFANIRPYTVLHENVRIGNFVEIKNSTIGKASSVSHLAYIGDAEIGKNTNIGAGTITCNYDGFEKHKTKIGDNVFIGSNSTLIAPVKIEDGAMTAAGSVVNKDVPKDALAVGRSRQENKQGWAKQWRQKHTKKRKAKQ